MKITTVLAALILVAVAPARAQEASGNRAYRKADYPASVERYRRAIERGNDSPRVHYNLGTALLRTNEREEAVNELRRGLEAKGPELRLQSFYNLGNARADVGEGGEPTMEELLEAAEAYKRALLLDPASVDAKWNLELTLRRIEEMQDASQSTSGGEQPPPPADDQIEGDQQQPPDGQGSGSPQQPERPTPQPLPSDVEEPLPRELAEQILRAVEERERDLQKEKQRRARTRTAGPDW